MIDLHTHTNESDGSCTPLELVDHALAMGLEALAISDHDTFAGYDLAVEPARSYGLDLVCAIELSTRMTGDKRRTVHVLAYFLQAPPSAKFREWVGQLLASRRERNVRLVAKLQSMGVPIELSEVERIGRTLTGRPHFARVLTTMRFAGISGNRGRRMWSGRGRTYPRPLNKWLPQAGWRRWRIRSGWECATRRWKKG